MQIVETANEGLKRAYTVTILAKDITDRIEGEVKKIAPQIKMPGFRPGSADGKLTVEGDNNAVGWTVGGLFSIDENTHIGLSYRSKVTHKITGGDARAGERVAKALLERA